MKNTSPVLVCVTPQLSCEKLISYGKELSSKLKCELCVVASLKKDETAKNISNALKVLNTLSKISESNIDIIYSNNAAKSLGSYINKVNPCHILIGNPIEGGRFFEEFMSNQYSAPVSIVNGEKEILYTLPASNFEVMH